MVDPCYPAVKVRSGCSLACAPETAALRWRHYEAAAEPLGRLTVALSYNTRKSREKSTKTEAVRVVPVHPVLAAMFAEWKLGGWVAMFGHTPEPDDLIVPLPPDAAARRRSRTGDAYRGHDYTGKRWREEDLPALGWRYREPYATKATFITLAIEDGARPEILRDRVTHGGACYSPCYSWCNLRRKLVVEAAGVESG